MTALRPTTDGVVTIRPPRPGDAAALVAGRDEVFHRFLGPGSDEPEPVGCIVVDGEVVGWVDYDTDRSWLGPGEVNVGYNVFADHRGRGCATRAVQLLLHHLAVDTPHRTATLLIDPDNERSLALARRAGFTRWGDLDGNPYWKRPVPPLTYTDGVVSMRRQEEPDLDAAFGTGPTWAFAVDTTDTRSLAYVACDLANPHVPHGDANISYSAHPTHRGEDHVARAVRLLLRFLSDHTGAREAHVIVDAENEPSRRVAGDVGGAIEVERLDVEGRTMIRHVFEVPRP